MRRRVTATGAVLLVLAGVVLWLRRGPPAPPELAPPGASDTPTSGGPGGGGPARPVPGSFASSVASASAAPAPSADTKAEKEKRFLAQMAEERKLLLTKFRYPPDSSPLATKTDLLLPHHVEPVMRGLSTTGDGKLRVEQNQSRIYLRPGQTAVASMKILFSGQPTAIDIKSSDLTREAAGQEPAKKLSSIAFRDDGVAPDDAAGDGTWTATVSTPSDNPPCGMQLYVDLSSNGETGRLFFPFIQTGPEPARFTHSVRSTIENGSVVFYVGIQVMNPGLFEILGRVYDGQGTPSVFCRFHDQVTPDTKEIRMVAYGAVLLDEGAVPPLTLRDLEGWRFSLGSYPDRDVMDEWDPQFTTPPFDSKLLTSQDFGGAEAQQRLAAFDQSTADGVANIRSQPGP